MIHGFCRIYRSWNYAIVEHGVATAGTSYLGKLGVVANVSETKRTVVTMFRINSVAGIPTSSVSILDRSGASYRRRTA